MANWPGSEGEGLSASLEGRKRECDRGYPQSGYGDCAGIFFNHFVTKKGPGLLRDLRGSTQGGNTISRNKCNESVNGKSTSALREMQKKEIGGFGPN